MRIQDFPRPNHDNRRGVHWSAAVYHPTGAQLDYWISELQAMHIKWVKVMDDSGGSSLELCQRLLAAEIMPIVRLYRLEPNPGHIGGREEDTVRRLTAAGVRYFETNNEPDLPAEWKDGKMPPNWMEIIIDNFIYDADRIIALGGLPALPAMGIGSERNPIATVIAKGRADLFEKGVWVAIHNYTLNHPLDYPYDLVNQEGVAISQEEYDRLGPWAWEGNPRELINEWRRTDKNPGDTLLEDAACFLGVILMDEMIVKTLGRQLPILSTEGGPVIGWKDDRRYPRVDPRTHAEWIVAINDFMQGNRAIHGYRCPNSYFTMCHWLIANYRLGFMAPGWESQSWYSDWWNADFNLKGALPVVAAVKAMPNIVDNRTAAVVIGHLVRADTGEPLPDLPVELMAQEQIVAATTSAADGAFRLPAPAPGVYDLAVPPRGIVRRGVVADVEPVQALTVLLTGGANSALSGKVLDHKAAPQAGVRVTLRRGAAVIGEADTAADGAFRFGGLPLGSYSLSIPGLSGTGAGAITVAGLALDGWASRSVKLTLGGAPSGKRYTLTQKRLLPPEESAGRRIFFGTVADAEGAGLNGIRLQMAWQGAQPGTQFPTTVTGADPFKPAGRYEFMHSPGLFAIRVVQGDWPSDVADDLDTAHAPGREGQPVSYQVDFQVQAAGAKARIDGQAPGAAGRKITLDGPTGAPEATLAADGGFAFPDLAPGSYKLALAGVGVIADDIALQAGALYKLIFPMRSRLRGQALAAPEGLIAVLHAPPAWGWTRQTPLDPDGGFAFEGLPAGSYRLELGSQTLPDLELNGENTLQLATIDLAQGRRSMVHGRVADAGGAPQPDVLMTLRRLGVLVAQTRTAADGGYRFANLPAGVYALEAASMGEVAGGIALDGQCEQVRDVLWRTVGPRGIIQGRVLSADGAAQADCSVRLLRDGAETARGQTAADGAFRFGELPAGVYALAVGDAALLVTDIQLADDATLVQDVILPPEPRKLLGHYLLFAPPATEPGESPRAEARLILALAGRYIHRSGASGGFSVADASQAAAVTIVGDETPVAVEDILRAAGCRVTRLSGDGYALAEAFERLLADAGRG